MNKKLKIEKLQNCIKKLVVLDTYSVNEPRFKKWKRDTEIAIEYIFGNNTRHIVDFSKVRFIPKSYDVINPGNAFEKAFINGFESSQAMLQSMIDEIKEYGDEIINNDQSKAEVSVSSNKIFIVHGHNEAVLEDVTKLLGKFNLEPIILHEQPNKGRTLIEKFEDYSEVGFAVVLLTSDDIGGGKLDSHDSLSPRARQNVILELGFFLGKLGRDRVCPVYEEGVVYMPYDTAGGWHLKLAQELQAAGYEIDLNNLMK